MAFCAAATHSSASRAVTIPRLSSSCARSEEHTSELQSPCNLVCRLLLEKKKNKFVNSSSILLYKGCLFILGQPLFPLRRTPTNNADTTPSLLSGRSVSVMFRSVTDMFI